MFADEVVGCDVEVFAATVGRREAADVDAVVDVEEPVQPPTANHLQRLHLPKVGNDDQALDLNGRRMKGKWRRKGNRRMKGRRKKEKRKRV